MNVLVVGCGSIGRRHIANLVRMRQIKRVYVYTKINNCEKLFDDREKKIISISHLSNAKADFAVICNETYKHIDAARILARNGINLFIEKPISHSLRGIIGLKKLAEKKHIKLAIGYNLRFLGAINFLKKLLKDKTIGKLYFSQIECGYYLPQWRKNISYKECYSSSRRKGGGVALDLSHELDYMRYLFGDPVSWKTFKARSGSLDINSEDIFEGLYCFKNNFICNVHLDYLQKQKKRVIRIVGSNGELICDLANGYINLKKKEKTHILKKRNLFNMDKTYKQEMINFINAIKRNKQPAVSIDDGVHVLRLLK